MSDRSPVNSVLRFVQRMTRRSRRSEQNFLDAVRLRARSLHDLDRAALRQHVEGLRDCAAPTAAPSSKTVIDSFALVFEAARQVLGIQLYDAQLLGGWAMTQTAIAEMQTGEGKTFAALLPACVHALAGKGVHVMTVNAYLAERDYELLTPVYDLLGISAGLISAEASPQEKRGAYQCDVTYGPGYEFGFDYLRDQVSLLSRKKPKLGSAFMDKMKGREQSSPTLMHRGQAVAIVDEADSVLIDEATTPLVLSSQGNLPAENAHVFEAARDMAGQLELGEDYLEQEPGPSLQLTDAGRKRLTNSAVPQQGLDRPWHAYVEQALRAKRIYRCDVHYVIIEDEIQIVDQQTGRIFADRSWRDGLHQAVQAKERVPITAEATSIARITRQRYFRLYSHLCGMTGTAQGSERELRDVFGLKVCVIAPHRPNQRVTQSPRVFATTATKEQAIADDVEQRYAGGQPVLIGTAAIEVSERLAVLLGERGIPFQLLNGKQDADEASIVARAGQRGAVTIATNMAGRGTDIQLGYGVDALGGLHVIASEPQESGRVDRQLVGRAARQGDPGSCQMFISADDTVLQQHAPMLARRIRQFGDVEAAADSAQAIAAKIDDLQARIEKQNALLRRQLFVQDDWVEQVLERM